MTDIRRTLLAAFRIEHREHLEFIRAALARFEEAGRWEQTELDEVFRRAHSLKGAARAVDLRPVEVMAHRLETLFNRMRTGQLVLEQAALALVHGVLNGIEDWVSSLEAAGSPVPPIQALDAIDAYLGQAESRAEPPPTPAAAPDRIPAAEPASRAGAAADDTVRIATSDLDRLLRSAGQLLTEGHGHELVSRRLRVIEAQIGDLDRQWKRLRKTLSADAGHRCAESLDTFGQALRALGKDTRRARIQQSRSGWSLRQLAGGLQDEVALARMVPAEHVFGGFRKMMRDLARDEGKEIDFRISGLDVRADRMVLQALKDPVMHMLRNAVFHGIEAPDERVRSGKPRAGKIALRFGLSGGRLVLAVEDDGRGIDFGRIVQVAVDSGLLSAEEAGSARRDEIARHIFRPGFSTAGDVSDLAGRGMGLSVVYQAVAKLNGSLDIPERPGPGTAFNLVVPLSVATHRLLLVECQDRILAVPTDGVERLARVRVTEVRSVEGRPVVLVDGRQLFLVSLAELLGMADAAVTTRDGVMPVVVLRSGEARVAVAVDAFLSIRDGLIQDLGFRLPDGSKVSGGTVMEDGSVVMVASPFQLVESCRHPERGGGLATVERAAAKKVPTILVVDDSFTTRTLEKSILAAHGYQVQVAVDGIEALTLLRGQEIDLVVADVQMPRLDGFGLLKEMKRDRLFAAIPVILVTSLESREDRERGLSLGASAYVVKRKFDQRELLETIEQLL